MRGADGAHPIAARKKTEINFTGERENEEEASKQARGGDGGKTSPSRKLRLGI